ncbi:MAG: hypothetical protein RR238_10425, partial [Lachnospiraceae bacterium]
KLRGSYMPDKYGDVVIPMVIAIISMWIFRIGAAYLLSVYWNMGLMGIWVAMIIDWIFRAICYTIRYLRGDWSKECFDKKQTHII